MSFKQLDLIDPILKALEEKGYKTPTPIQASAIPHILKRRDVVGCAQTGSGKTAAFAIPILQLVYNQENNTKGKFPIRCLIVTPTRELAIQIDENFKAYSKYTNIKSTVIFGGVSQGEQVRKIKAGVHILTATPGRLLDLMNQGIVSLSDIKLFVLDEADRMLDMGFIHDIKKLLKVIPKKRQSLFFSATMPDNITKLANTILDNPERVEVTPVSSTVDTIQQFVYYTNKKQKRDLLLHVLQDEKMESVLVFTRTKYGADKVARLLTKKGSKAAAIHGDKSQNNRQRALKAFKEGKLRVLVATDIAARGIDIDSLKYVINFEISNMPETYVHRIGRSGRAGKDGVAISFCDHDERAYVKDIQKLTGRKLEEVGGHPFPQSEFDPAIDAKKQDQKRNHNKSKSQHNNKQRNDRKKLSKNKPPRSKFSEKRAVKAENKGNKERESLKNENGGNTKDSKSHKQSEKDLARSKPPAGKKKPYNKNNKKKKGMPEGLKKKMKWPLG